MKPSAVVCRQMQKLILEELFNNQNGLFYLANIFHDGPQAFANPQFFPMQVKSKQTYSSFHFLFFDIMKG